MKPVIDVERMLVMKGTGMSNADIARALGVTTSAVWQQLRKLEANIKNVKSKIEASKLEPAEETPVQEQTVDIFPEVEQAETVNESPIERIGRERMELAQKQVYLDNVFHIFSEIETTFGTDTANRCLELIRPILDGEA
jgi:predicted transcriptional regulator